MSCFVKLKRSESHSSSCSDYPPTTADSASRPLGLSASTARLSVSEIRISDPQAGYVQPSISGPVQVLRELTSS